MNQTPHRICVRAKENTPDPRASQLKKAIQNYYQFPLEDLQIETVYQIKKPLTKEQLIKLASGPLADPILEESSLESVSDAPYDWEIEIGYKTGLTDNTGNTAQSTIEDVLEVSFTEGERVDALTCYKLKGELTQTEVRQLAEELLANPLIEEIGIRKLHPHLVEEVHLDVDDHQLMEISKDRCLALNLKEMHVIKEYYANPGVQQERARHGLPPCPTDVEIEAIAQTWSEHCKHKIFNAKIHFQKGEAVEVIDSLFKTYIKGATDTLSSDCDWLVSVFHDNAGIIRFTDSHNIAFKVETHNSPSALDPYGGALTGILGVNRDILGVGIGAKLIGNTDVFCFASPDYNQELPPRLLHPRRIFEGVRRGVEHGGNKSGVPTVNGSIVFDDRYLGKPLVYCGTVGILPREVQGVPTESKEIHAGDLIVIAGGRTGKDGIHGATFSSEALHADSPSSAVQIGDPFTQKKVHDFLLEARDELLFRSLTDNGAGGFSSSVGELASLSGGCEIHLDRAKLKYQGLVPWEILVSESQERMTLAVPPDRMERLKALADKHEVELCSIGSFTSSSYFHILYNSQTVAHLPLKFLHDGLPQMELEAALQESEEKSLDTPEHFHLQDMHEMLKRLNICSRESVIRQYDHEVQASTIIKPLQGQNQDGPGNASILHPVEARGTNQGIVVSNGICPKFSAFDTYHMAANAVDEAIRNAVCVGCDPKHIAILDNFCWPDPVFDEKKTPDGKHKLAQLVRASQGLYDAALAFKTPIISGKDSMKNDYQMGGVKISVPPTLLISAIGVIPDIEKAVTMEFKVPGDWIYVVGLTKNELGGSEYAGLRGLNSGVVPKVDFERAAETYEKIYESIQNGWIASCHDCSDGGLGIALVESSFSGNLGASIDLHPVPMEGIENDTQLLFSESPSRLIVTVSPENAKSFEQLFHSIPIGRIGIVQKDPHITIEGLSGETILDEELEPLKKSWQQPIGELS